MKKLFVLLLCGIFVLNLVSCNRIDNPEETDSMETVNAMEDTTELQYAFITYEEKCTWKSKLTAVLSKVDIRDYELGLPGSLAIGLMDINFDNSPEVFVAYAGGSIGNVFFDIYDLDSGDKLVSYNAAHWENDDNIYLCVADKKGELTILSEGSLRNLDIGWMKLTHLLPKNIDSQSIYLMAENLFAESLSNEVEHYEYKGNVVEKSQYDEYYRIFLDEYNKIESTQIQLIRWTSIESESRDELVEKMADALISSPQEFIDNKK